MSENPADLLNVDETPSPQTPRDGAWWLAALLSLALCTGLGVTVALTLPRQESDWFGARYLLALGGGLLVGALLCVVCATVSLIRRERRTVWSAIVALPCLVLLLSLGGEYIQAAVYKSQAKTQAHERAQLTEQYRQQIRRDPTIALREQWHRPSAAVQYAVFRTSFDDATVPYTVELLQRIYDEAPAMRDHLFRHPACTAEFLARHFPAACKYDRDFSYVRLANLVSNPNAPLELVEQVAHAEHLPVGATEAAKAALKKRRAP